MNDYPTCDATELAARVRRGEVQPIELVEKAIAGIEAVNPTLNAVMHPMYEAARAAARSLPDGPFRGFSIRTISCPLRAPEKAVNLL